MTEVTPVGQSSMPMAPAENAKGAISAREQIRRGISAPATWEIAYDRQLDRLGLYAPDAGPAISYFDPRCPDVVYRLDVTTGVLVGIELERFRSVLVKTEPEFAEIDRLYRTIALLARIPPLRWLWQAGASVATSHVAKLTNSQLPAC